MNSIILRQATRILYPLLLVFSVFILLRGHNTVGGGFVGGLIAAAAFSLYSIAFGVDSACKILRFNPIHLIAAGLSTAMISGLVSLTAGLPYLTGRWGAWDIFGIFHLELGTPFFFDVGVYLVVTGAALSILLNLKEE